MYFICVRLKYKLKISCIDYYGSVYAFPKNNNFKNIYLHLLLKCFTCL